MRFLCPLWLLLPLFRENQNTSINISVERVPQYFPPRSRNLSFLGNYVLIKPRVSCPLSRLHVTCIMNTYQSFTNTSSSLGTNNNLCAPTRNSILRANVDENYSLYAVANFSPYIWMLGTKRFINGKYGLGAPFEHCTCTDKSPTLVTVTDFARAGGWQRGLFYLCIRWISRIHTVITRKIIYTRMARRYKKPL